MADGVAFQQAGWLRAIVAEMRALGIRRLSWDGRVIELEADPAVATAPAAAAPPGAEAAPAAVALVEPAEDPELVYASGAPPRRKAR